MNFYALSSLIFVYYTQESFHFKVQPPTKEPIKGIYINEHYERAITFISNILLN